MIENKILSILHIGWGFYPWRKGGLILYARDLMKEQIKAKHRVYYFCAGRKLPIINKSFLHSRVSDKLHIWEIINSSISHKGDSGTLQPELTLVEPFSEKCFSTIIQKVKPDIVHIHELAGLPSSIIDLIVDKYRIPCLMTLADYYLLCPCLKLFNHLSKENCRLQCNLGSACLQCNLSSPKYHRNDLFETASLLLTDIEAKLSLTDVILWQKSRNFCSQVYAYLQKYRYKSDRAEKHNKVVSRERYEQLKIQFKKRRILNSKRLKKITQLVARSHKVKQIYDIFLGTEKQISVVNPYLHHIDLISPKKMISGIKKVKFVTLNGFISIQKGGTLLMDAVISLNKQGYSNRFEIHSYGQVQQIYVEKLNCQPNFFDHGQYEADQLDQLLNPMHVGIVPSIWEEVFGYVGLELLSKGLPVIASKKGGITDYLIHDENGFLNESCSVEELVFWMKKYIEDKNEIFRHNQNILQSSKRTYSEHYSQIMHTYRQVLQKHERNLNSE